MPTRGALSLHCMQEVHKYSVVDMSVSITTMKSSSQEQDLSDSYSNINCQLPNMSPSPSKAGRAWEEFSDHIKNIDTDHMHFTMKPTTKRRSSTFTNIINDVYVQNEAPQDQTNWNDTPFALQRMMKDTPNDTNESSDHGNTQALAKPDDEATELGNDNNQPDGRDDKTFSKREKSKSRSEKRRRSLKMSGID